MFVKRLFTENWDGRQINGLEVGDPSWPQIEAAIRDLDGHRHTQVVIAADDDRHMSVGGGNEGYYTVYVTFDNERFYNLISRDTGDSPKALVVGGQEAEYPGELCVSLEQVLAAASSFSELGELNQNLTWQEE